MARGFRIGYGPPGTFSVAADGYSYIWAGNDADLVYSEAGGSGNVGQVGSYADMDLATYPIYSIDMGLNDYGVHANSGGAPGTGSHSHVNAAWPLGGTGYVRITPPTTDGFERGVNVTDLWNNATLAIQDFNFRFEWRANSTFCSFNGTGPKFCIVQTRRTLAIGNAEERPMMYLRPMDTADNSSQNRANTQVMSIGQGTTSGWSPLVYDDTWDGDGGTLSGWPNSIQPWYMVNDGDTGTFQGQPKVEVGEAVTFEMRILTTTSVEYDRGLIAMRMYRENGQVFERGIPWNLDTGAPFGAYVWEIKMLGCGEWNTAPGANAQWMDVGGYITVARDLNGWLGRRSAT